MCWGPAEAIAGFYRSVKDPLVGIGLFFSFWIYCCLFDTLLVPRFHFQFSVLTFLFFVLNNHTCKWGQELMIMQINKVSVCACFQYIPAVLAHFCCACTCALRITLLACIQVIVMWCPVWILTRNEIEVEVVNSKYIVKYGLILYQP